MITYPNTSTIVLASESQRQKLIDMDDREFAHILRGGWGTNWAANAKTVVDERAALAMRKKRAALDAAAAEAATLSDETILRLIRMEDGEFLRVLGGDWGAIWAENARQCIAARDAVKAGREERAATKKPRDPFARQIDLE